MFTSSGNEEIGFGEVGDQIGLSDEKRQKKRRLKAAKGQPAPSGKQIGDHLAGDSRVSDYSAEDQVLLSTVIDVDQDETTMKTKAEFARLEQQIHDTDAELNHMELRFYRAVNERAVELEGLSE